jgi:hypothetical protein
MELRGDGTGNFKHFIIIIMQRNEQGTALFARPSAPAQVD